MNFYTNKKILQKVENIVKNDGFEKDFTYHYIYIVSHIRMYRYLNRKFMYEEFVPIKINYLRNCISYNNAHIFIKNLIDAGVLETDNHFIQGRKAKGYKITKMYLEDKFFLVPINDKRLLTKLQKLRKINIERVYLEGYGYEYVTKFMEELSIDKTKALQLIEKTILEEGHKKNCYKSMVEVFDQKFATVDEKAKRLHNSLTNLGGSLRQFLSYKGKKIEGIDIKSSQPMFLYFKLKKDFNVEKKEMDKYLDLVLNKGFYEFFAKKLNFKLTVDNRKNFKIAMFSKVLFDRNRKTENKYVKVFKKEFPAIYYSIYLIKQKDHTEMALSLQRLESSFIFDAVERIAKQHSIPLFTIHDSISTTEGNINKVLKIVEEDFIIKYGLTPKLHTEKY